MLNIKWVVAVDVYLSVCVCVCGCVSVMVGMCVGCVVVALDLGFNNTFFVVHFALCINAE